MHKSLFWFHVGKLASDRSPLQSGALTECDFAIFCGLVRNLLSTPDFQDKYAGGSARISNAMKGMLIIIDRQTSADDDWGARLLKTCAVPGTNLDEFLGPSLAKEFKSQPVTRHYLNDRGLLTVGFSLYISKLAAAIASIRLLPLCAPTAATG